MRKSKETLKLSTSTGKEGSLLLGEKTAGRLNLKVSVSQVCGDASQPPPQFFSSNLVQLFFLNVSVIIQLIMNIRQNPELKLLL